MEFVTIQQAARLLRLSPITVRRYIASGRLPALEIGGALRVRREAVDRFGAPVETKNGRPRAPRRLGHPVTEEWLANLIGIAGTDDEVPTDVSSSKHDHLVAVYADLHER